jgi:hypothetical protein
MQEVPLQPIQNQVLQVQLNGQPTTIELAQYRYGLFMTVLIGTTVVIAGVLCQNFNRIIRSDYLGYDGDLFFVDTQGNTDPAYTGFGGGSARYHLIYATAAELGGA